YDTRRIKERSVAQEQSKAFLCRGEENRRMVRWHSLLGGAVHGLLFLMPISDPFAWYSSRLAGHGR
ncbi:MAG TPA: hypothetical protein PLV85_13670, partial [Polyangiaceae bacterium]|nr:hypothetical protein [Polyangiaceae bacterium]